MFDECLCDNMRVQHRSACFLLDITGYTSDDEARAAVAGGLRAT